MIPLFQRQSDAPERQVNPAVWLIRDQRCSNFCFIVPFWSKSVLKVMLPWTVDSMQWLDCVYMCIYNVFCICRIVCQRLKSWSEIAVDFISNAMPVMRCLIHRKGKWDPADRLSFCGGLNVNIYLCVVFLNKSTNKNIVAWLFLSLLFIK